jgi:hypothetical protein
MMNKITRTARTKKELTMFLIYSSYENAKFNDIKRHVEKEQRLQNDHREPTLPLKPVLRASLVLNRIASELIQSLRPL